MNSPCLTINPPCAAMNSPCVCLPPPASGPCGAWGHACRTEWLPTYSCRCMCRPYLRRSTCSPYLCRPKLGLVRLSSYTLVIVH
eukprot:2460838-Pyramimonas_sp.AAC.1